jgi:hypothetical protein
MVMLAFSTYRFRRFILKEDPNVSRQNLLRNLDNPTEFLTPSDYGLEFAIGIGKPIEPEYGSLVANLMSFDYLEDKSINSKIPRKRIKTKTQLDMVPCGFDYFKGFDPAKIDMYNIPNLMCIKDRENFTVRGDYYSEEFRYIEIRLFRCDKNSSKIKCKSEAEIDEFFKQT